MEECQQGAFRTPLNTFLLSVCDPGGRKSSTYNKVMNIEKYTTAGIQNPQIKTNGYGLITSDEGYRFLNSIQVKQKNGEAERAFLCKLWGGKGKR